MRGVKRRQRRASVKPPAATPYPCARATRCSHATWGAAHLWDRMESVAMKPSACTLITSSRLHTVGATRSRICGSCVRGTTCSRPRRSWGGRRCQGFERVPEAADYQLRPLRGERRGPRDEGFEPPERGGDDGRPLSPPPLEGRPLPPLPPERCGRPPLPCRLFCPALRELETSRRSRFESSRRVSGRAL